MRAFLRIALALVVAAALSAADDDLMLSPRQDAAAWEKAWRTWVHADYRGRDLGEIIADLSTQAGLAIGCYVPEYPTYAYGSGLASGWWTCRQPQLRASAARFVDGAGAARLRRTTIRFHSYGGTYDLQADEPVPLAVLLASFPKHLFDVSYREGAIAIAPPSQLRPEVVITRSVQLSHPWGWLWTARRGGVPLISRVPAVDAYAWQLLCSTPVDGGDGALRDAAGRSGKPDGVAARLHDAATGVDAAIDERSGMLTLTGHPAAVANVLGTWVPLIDQPSPEDSVAEAHAFALSRVRDLRPKEAQPLLDRLDDGDADAEEIESQLIALHASAEVEEVRKTIDHYFAAAAAGDFDEIRRSIWDTDRRQDDERDAREFGEDLAAALAGERGAAAWFKKTYQMEAQPGLTHDQYLRRRMSVEPRIQRIRRSGPRAEVVYNADVIDSRRGVLRGHRAISVFTMLFSDGQWRVHRGVVMNDPQPEVWPPTADDAPPRPTGYDAGF